MWASYEVQGRAAERVRRKAAAAAAESAAAATAAANADAAALASASTAPRYAGELLAGPLDVRTADGARFDSRFVSVTRSALRVWASADAYASAGEGGAPLFSTPLAGAVAVLGAGVNDGSAAPPTPYVLRLLPSFPAGALPLITLAATSWAGMSAWHTTLQKWTQPAASPAVVPAPSLSTPAPAPMPAPVVASAPAPALAPDAVPPARISRRSITRGAGVSLLPEADVIAALANVAPPAVAPHTDGGAQTGSSSSRASTRTTVEPSAVPPTRSSGYPVAAAVQPPPAPAPVFASKPAVADLVGRLSDEYSGAFGGAAIKGGGGAITSAPAVTIALRRVSTATGSPLPPPPPPPPASRGHSLPLTERVTGSTEASRARAAAVEADRLLRVARAEAAARAEREADVVNHPARGRVGKVQRGAARAPSAGAGGVGADDRKETAGINTDRVRGARGQSSGAVFAHRRASSHGGKVVGGGGGGGVKPNAAQGAGAGASKGTRSVQNTSASSGSVWVDAAGGLGMRGFVASAAAAILGARAASAERAYAPDRMNDFHRALGLRAPSSSRRSFVYPRGHYEGRGWATSALGRKEAADAALDIAVNAFGLAHEGGVLPRGGDASVRGSGAPPTAAIVSPSRGFEREQRPQNSALPSPVKGVDTSADVGGVGDSSARRALTSLLDESASGGVGAASLSRLSSSLARSPPPSHMPAVVLVARAPPAPLSFRPAGPVSHSTGSALERSDARARPAGQSATSAQPPPAFRALSPGVKRAVMWGGQAWPAAEAAVLCAALDSSCARGGGFDTSTVGGVNASMTSVQRGRSSGANDSMRSATTAGALVARSNAGAGADGAAAASGVGLLLDHIVDIEARLAAATAENDALRLSGGGRGAWVGSGGSGVVESVLAAPSDVSASLSSCVAAARAISASFGGGGVRAAASVPTTVFVPVPAPAPAPAPAPTPAATIATQIEDDSERSRISAIVDSARRVRGAISGAVGGVNVEDASLAASLAAPPAVLLPVAQPKLAAAALSSSTGERKNAPVLLSALVSAGFTPSAAPFTSLTLSPAAACAAAVSALGAPVPASTVGGRPTRAVAIIAPSIETALSFSLNTAAQSVVVAVLEASAMRAGATVSALAIAAMPSAQGGATILDGFLPSARRARVDPPKLIGGGEGAPPHVDGAVIVRIADAADVARLVKLLPARLSEAARAATAAAAPLGAAAVALVIDTPTSRTVIAFLDGGALRPLSDGGLAPTLLTGVEPPTAAGTALERLLLAQGGVLVTLATVKDTA